MLLSTLLHPPAAVRFSIGGLILGFAIIALPWMAIQPHLAPPGQGGMDKLLHMVCFAGLAFIGLWMARGAVSRGLILLVLLVLGAGIEWLQASAPGREGSFSDLAADAVGLLVALILLRCWSMARNMLSPKAD